MRKPQSRGMHHVTLVGADRQSSIDVRDSVPGMPLISEQPDLDRGSESPLSFDPGDGRLITILTDDARRPDPRRTPTVPGGVHHAPEHPCREGPPHDARRPQAEVLAMRAAGLPVEEVGAHGQARTPEVRSRHPCARAPMIAEPGLPKGLPWESRAIMAHPRNRRGLARFYPARASTRRAACATGASTILPSTTQTPPAAASIAATTRRAQSTCSGGGVSTAWIGPTWRGWIASLPV